MPLEQARGVLVTQLSWSANGRWLAWAGSAILTWDRNEVGTSGLLGGVLADDGAAGPVRRLPEPEIVGGDTLVSGDVPSYVAVSDAGELAAVSGNALWRDGRTTRFPLADGQRLRGAWFRGDTVMALRQADGDDGRAYLVQVPSLRATMVTTRLADPRRVGQVDGLTQVLAHEAIDEDGSPQPAATLLTEAPRGGVERQVITIDRGVLGLTLATDLMDAEPPTVERPAPDWPWSAVRRAAVVVLAVAGVLLLAGAGWLVRRRLTR